MAGERDTRSSALPVPLRSRDACAPDSVVRAFVHRFPSSVPRIMSRYP